MKNTGFEHIYVVFSATRWSELEDKLSQVEQIEAAPKLTTTRSIDQPFMLSTRGLGGMRPTTTPTGDNQWTFERIRQGTNHHLQLPSRIFQASSAPLVIERWFRHTEPK